MTQLIEGIRVLKYEEWVNLPSVKQMGATLKKCDTCYGDGEHECECGDTHECQACGGSGKEENYRDIYEAILRDEIQRLKGWISGEGHYTPLEKHLAQLVKEKQDRGGLITLNIHGNPN
jgi:DnaJ-class molecular chaperone